jgi:hypothetical protein
MHTIKSLMLSLIIGLCYATTSTSGFGMSVGEAVDVTEQINKTITLAPGSNVRISGINGSVTIETLDGDKGEINITIRASDREAMERRPWWLRIRRTA